MSTDADSDAFERVKRELADLVVSGEVDRDELESVKNSVCGKHGAEKVPKNSDILEAVPDEERDEAESVLQTTPVRTASGVTPVAVMTSPAPCPHGKCVYCPGGPDSEFESPMSYTGEEPAAMRGKHNDYDPYDQVTQRLSDLRETGHLVDKVELILMGGTLTSRSLDYQEWFVRRCLEAMNTFGTSEGEDNDWKPFEEVETRNETADVRNIGTTFETKPDWCGKEQIDHMLRLGGTKVEMGVQTTDDETLRLTHRGHGDAETREANRRLHDAGFKVGFHMMPGLPGRDPEDDIDDFREIFDNPEYRPDYLKIYPTLVVEDTGLYKMWQQGEFEPLGNEEAADVVARAKRMIPEYTRLSRVQRDIPADNIEAGVWKSNLRQLARHRLDEIGGDCDCIRCREVGMNDEAPDDLDFGFDMTEYGCAGGDEKFLQYKSESGLLAGFLRLRFPGQTVRSELEDSAIVREVHVYGDEVGVGRQGDGFQHSGLGTDLVERAEEMSRDAGYSRLSVISGIGVREYYRSLGYEKDGPYMVKDFE
ncbi:MAG: tRNA uridine(34) 5-carboxymethylaminomethyl modification radical SAM/GNAT enzyme Elp3 [Halobacteria archaeon]|nr:tRNA uridine(34) 5-carboxymethylaminomethyl modification radical SAM/GNAT enzyme Elp3 [Halobacteria archaeon]